MRNATKEELESINAYIKSISEIMIPLSVLQEIKQDIDEWYQFPHSSLNWLCYTKLCEIFDKHINNDQFERIWQNTVEEMKRRKICEDILEEAEEWDSETMSGSLLTDDDLRQLINDGINKCKEEHTYTPIKNNFDLSETGCTDKKCPFYLNPDYTRCKECGAERSDNE